MKHCIVEEKFNINYLTKQNRRSGQNHKWSEDEIEKIRKVVEEAQLHWPQSCFAKAAEILRYRHKGPTSIHINPLPEIVSKLHGEYQEKLWLRNIVKGQHFKTFALRIGLGTTKLGRRICKK